MKKERNIALAVCAMLAALILLLTSQSSPLYPINLWGDANCLFTVGRVMKDGGVLYRDIYEQKGPLLYLIHALAACLSDTSFWGVYIMEALAMTAALYAAYRLMRLRAGMGFSLGAAAFFGAAFAIMTFNNDANVTDVFAKLYEMIIGTRADGPTILEASYSVGLALGILLFFNHFASWKITVDPTPIEVEMRLYEENLNKTLIKNGGRKESGVDVS